MGYMYYNLGAKSFNSPETFQNIKFQKVERYSLAGSVSPAGIPLTLAQL